MNENNYQSLNPLKWNIFEKKEKDDIWPKRVVGANMVYLEDKKKYVLIGGNFNALENTNKNFKLNRDLLAGVDKNINNFNKLEKAKIDYLAESVANNHNNLKTIDTYIYEIEPERKWYKISPSGRVPKARSFHKCIVMNNYIFCFGGVELGPQGENLSHNDLYVFNSDTYEWKLIICKKYPYDRSDFAWVKFDNSAILYGGAASPNQFFYDDMWTFNYDGHEFSTEIKKEIQKDYWCERDQKGNLPGKLRAFSMEYSYLDSCLYLFGGLDSHGKNKNELFKYNTFTSEWSLVATNGKGPSSRCYHEMKLINKDNFVVYGGIYGSLSKIETVHNDVYVYNVHENIWIEPCIGGIKPSPRFGFSLCSNYVQDKMEVLIMGGHSFESESSTMKIYVLSESESESKYLWNIRDVKYKEEQNDEIFLIHSEQSIHEYKDKINALEIDIRNKENAIEEMRLQVEDYKKKIYKSHGYIDDQSQSLDEHIKELKIQKKNIKQSLEIDKKNTNLKLKLKYIMQRKVQKTMEFFCNQSDNKQLANLFSKAKLDIIKKKYNEKLGGLKNSLEHLNSKDELISTDLHRYKKFEKTVDELFKEEIDFFKITEEF